MKENEKRDEELALKYIAAKDRIRQINLEVFLSPTADRQVLLDEKKELVKFVKEKWGQVNLKDR